MSVSQYTDIDLKKINYGKPEKQGVIYYAPINYNNEPFYLQSPKMICKSDGAHVIDKKNNSLELETLNTDYSFYDFLLNIDARNIKETFRCNEDWFGKSIPLEVIDDMYKRTCKPVKKDSKPIFTFKVPVSKGKVQCLIYDQKKTCLDISKLTEGCEITCIVHIKGLKFLKQHYYCDCYISQIKIYLDAAAKFSILDTYSFNDTEDEERELKDLNNEIELDAEIMEQLRLDEKRKTLTTELLKREDILRTTQKEIDDIQQALHEL
tara:strand:+ start:2834 stop:3628 length:795 start_codon:yes stop_codon:yes gene_type:complete